MKIAVATHLDVQPFAMLLVLAHVLRKDVIKSHCSLSDIKLLILFEGNDDK